MALIKTIAEIKAVLPKFVSNTTAPSALPNFDQSEYKYLVPVVGVTLYNSISTKYNDPAYPGNMTADEKSLLKKMQLVGATYAFLDELALGQLILTENGFQKKATQQTYRWEYEALKDTLKTIAADGTEVLINFLFEKKFPDFLSDSVYQQLTKLLIRTGTEFDQCYKLFQPNRTYFSIRPDIEDVQELYLTEGIGRDLLNYLLTTDPLPGDADFKLGLQFLKKSLSFFTIKQCVRHHSVKFSDAGFTVMSGRENQDTAESQGVINAGAADMQIKMEACNEQGNDYLKRCRQLFVKYYKKDTVDADFKTAFEAGPLVNFVDPASFDLGNESRTGVFRM